MNKIEVKVKPIANGTKRHVEIFVEGVLCGSRASARPYRYALLVTRSQQYELQNAVTCEKHARAQAEKFRAIHSRESVAYARAVNEYGKVRIEQLINDSEYITWANSEDARAARYREQIARLSSGPQPEYAKPLVASWHHLRKNVPSAPHPWQIFFALVEIPA